MFSVWEVRHGSVMALREILTYQGASAGVLMSDLNFDSASSSTFTDIGEEITTDREGQIDLNMQILSDESQPALKRPKIEGASSQLKDTMIYSHKDDNLSIHVKVEDAGWNLPMGQANGEVISSVNVELGSESHLNNAWDPSDCMSNTKIHCEDKVSMEKTDILKILPKNPELLNLVKMARHSWLKNCEFLRDCAIRFLCVLSLDRYDPVFALKSMIVLCYCLCVFF